MLAFPYPNLTVPHLNMLTPSVPEFSLPSLVSFSVASDHASKSKWDIKIPRRLLNIPCRKYGKSWMKILACPFNWHDLTTLTNFKSRYHYWSLLILKILYQITVVKKLMTFCLTIIGGSGPLAGGHLISYFGGPFWGHLFWGHFLGHFLRHFLGHFLVALLGANFGNYF